jgi:GT2 family glycosyltransferase
MTANDCLIEIIIPNWNGKELLAVCLQSLREQTSREFCVTVVDNGSHDGSVSFLEQFFPEVKCISFVENRGFSVAINEGVRRSTCPWLFLLNNDIEVADTCIASLLEAIHRYPGYDFFALKMKSYHQRHIIDGAGDAVLRGGVGYRLGTLEEDRGQYDVDRDVFGACAGAALYSRRFFAEIGLFDEDFFAYLEDVDLNMRARRAGMGCRYIASAVVYHVGSATSGSKFNPLTIRLSTRNNINVLVKNYPLSLLCRYLPAIFIYQLAWLAFVIKKGQIVAYWQGLWQGLRQIGTMWRKRSEILAAARISPQQFACLLSKSEREAIESIMARRQALNKGNALLKLYSKLFL